MSLRDRLRRDDSPDVRRYQMREQLLSIGDDYWIEDETGRRAFKVDGKAVRVRDTFVLRDASGQEAAKIQERKLRVRDTMEIEQPGGNATVRKAFIGLRDRFKIDVEGGPDLNATAISSITSMRSSATEIRSPPSRGSGSGYGTRTAWRSCPTRMRQ